MGGSPDTPEQSDPELEEKKAKRKALALSQAYEAKTAALGMGSTQLYGKKSKGQQKKAALDGLKTHVPATGDRETADGVYKQATGNARSRMATEMEDTRRKRNSKALEAG
jgi:hypothetical protein